MLVVATGKDQIPGTALGQKAEGREEHASFGPAMLASLFSVTPETLLQINSHSKTFTATAVWHLIAYGALTLEASSSTWLPDLTLAGPP